MAPTSSTWWSCKTLAGGSSLNAASIFRRWLAHPLARYLAVLALAAAVLQSIGRLGAWLLDDFEGALNAYLGEGRHHQRLGRRLAGAQSGGSGGAR